jgi:hypothetical protein
MNLRHISTLTCLIANILSWIYLKYNSGDGDILEWITTGIIVFTFVYSPMILVIATFRPEKHSLKD